MKKIIMLVSFLLIVSPMFAAPVSRKTAEQVAMNWISYQSGKNVENIAIENIITTEYRGSNVLYTFTFKGGGFAIISGNDQAKPVLGYDTESKADVNDIPIQLKDWIDQYSKEINQIRVDNLTSKDNELKWNNILKNKFSVYKNNYYYQYGPYIDHIKWNQNSPWNEKCPEHPDGPGGHCYAGCAAVAMAQVMKYMEYPKVYDWDSMENTTCGIEIQVLLYDCGVSVDMNYGPESSSASIGDVDDGLIDEFDYSPSNVTYLQRKNSSLYSWRRNIGDDLRIRKTPIIYSGENNDGSASHAFVLDGYKLYTGYNWEYHFNFGWSGSWNGWFKLDCIEPGEHNYNYNQSAVFKIIPSTRGKEEFETVENEIPEVMNLPQNYPNPFNPETTISFTATESTKITEITIYNNNGQKVNTLVSKILPAGEHSVVWNGTDNTGNKVSSGIYYYKMTNGKFTDIKKMLMIK